MTMNFYYTFVSSEIAKPGDPVKGVAELGGVVERGEEASNAAATVAALAAD